jgi:hypothetical protein
MKLKNGRRIGRRALSLAVTAVVMLAVLFLNIGFTVLSSKNLWFADLTPEEMYGLTDVSKTYLTNAFDKLNADRRAMGEKDVEVEIIFCADRDILRANERMRYVYYTALQLQKAFPKTIKVEVTDVWKNPSSVDAYRTNAFSSIYQDNIIIASGSEFRITSIDAFYGFTQGEKTPWAYYAEKRYVQTILAVTQAEAPICALTVNHGEPFATEEGKAQYSAFLDVIRGAGYKTVFLDLDTQEIPENCRLIITFDPQTDFLSKDKAQSGVSEISRLETYLDRYYSFLIFADADTPLDKLPNLTEYLSEWGVVLNRHTDKEQGIFGNYHVVSDFAVDANGTMLIGAYEPEAVGGSITKSMREKAGSPKVIFPNAIPISYSPSYQQTFVLANEASGTGAFHYGQYYRNNRMRNMFDIFRSDSSAVAQVKLPGGETLTDEQGNPVLVNEQGDYKLMTLTREQKMVSEGKGYTSVTYTAYVGAVGSTEFASNELLLSNAYGNTDVLLQTLRAIGQEVVPVDIALKPMHKDAMTAISSSTGEAYFTKKGNTTWTVVLVLLPAAVFATLGITVLVRRKYKT